MVNVADWATAVGSMTQPHDNGSDDEDGEDEAVTLNEHSAVQFFRAVAGIQSMGMIRSNKRKTDHVTRMVFGGI